MPPLATTVGFLPVEPVQMQPIQNEPHLGETSLQMQQKFHRFLTEESPQIFRQFQQWLQKQPAPQQHMMAMPLPQTQPLQPQLVIPTVQQQTPVSTGAGFQNSFSRLQPSPQLPHQTPIHTREETPKRRPVLDLGDASPTSRLASRIATYRAQSKASSRGSKKEDRSSLAPIMDTANMVFKKLSRRHRKSKKQSAVRTDSESADQSEAEDVDAMQEVKQEDHSTVYATFDVEQSEAKEVNVQQVKQELQVPNPKTCSVHQSKAEEVGLKREVKKERQDVHSVQFKMEQSKAQEIEVKHEKQELQVPIPGKFGAHQSKAREVKVKLEAKHEDQAVMFAHTRMVQPKTEELITKQEKQLLALLRSNVYQANAGEVRVKQEVKQHDHDAMFPQVKIDRFKADEVKVKQEKQETHTHIPVKSGVGQYNIGGVSIKKEAKTENHDVLLAQVQTNQSKAEEFEMKRNIKMENQAAIPATSNINHSHAGEFDVKHGMKTNVKPNADQGVEVKLKPL